MSSQVVLQLTRTRVREQIPPANSDAVVLPRSREVVVLGLILAILQVLDGYLTGIGVYHFGTDIEGNVLLRSLMESYGFVPTLVMTKTVALGIIVLLCSMCTQVSWLRSALKAVIAIYVVGAVIPWCYIVSQHIL
ncbi:MAG: hypothetical protein RL417_2431 [Pseudomonadota bacterium]|jgi:hypothetical protein